MLTSHSPSLLRFLFLLMPFAAFAQTDNRTGTSQQRTAVNVLVTDFKNEPRPGEQIIFISKKSGEKFSGRAGKDGKFSTTLPIGDTLLLK
jgi:hypothetical protein